MPELPELPEKLYMKAPIMTPTTTRAKRAYKYVRPDADPWLGGTGGRRAGSILLRTVA